MKQKLTYYEDHTWQRVKGILDFMNLTQISSRWQTDKNGERSLLISLGRESKPETIAQALDRMRMAFRNATAFRTADTVLCEGALKLPTICVCFTHALHMRTLGQSEPVEEKFVQITQKELDRLKKAERENEVLKTMNRDLQARVTELENKGVENGI